LSQDGEGDAADAFRGEDIEETPFDPSIEHRVRRLVDEQWGAELAEDSDRLGGAPVRVRGDPYIEGFSGYDGRVQGTERLLERGLGVVMMVVEDVDVIEAEAAQALVETQTSLGSAHVTL
jgi:hypothetical protein